MKRLKGGEKCKSGCDICTDPNCCQSFMFTEELESLWGSNFQKYYEKVERAAGDTRGEVLTSGGTLIAALYHSSAGGMTEDSEAVFAVALPYLVSVESRGEENQPCYRSEKVFSNGEFIELLNAAYPQAELARPSEQVDIWGRTDSGRVKLVQLGGTVISGQQLRSTLGLHSTNFSFEFTEDEVKIICIGYGHGVGMSQCGANAMAGEGSDYREILMHYYTGVEIVRMAE